MSVYKRGYELAGTLANRVAQECFAIGNVKGVRVIGMPAEVNGVYFSRFEFQYRLQQQTPGVKIDFRDSAECGNLLCYVWQPDGRTLLRYEHN